MMEIQDSDAAWDASTIWDYLQGPEAQVVQLKFTRDKRIAINDNHLVCLKFAVT